MGMKDQFQDKAESPRRAQQERPQRGGERPPQRPEHGQRPERGQRPEHGQPERGVGRRDEESERLMRDEDDRFRQEYEA
ncbi:hypothetical protein F9278_19490 [Streptomyces phaeolivaceus]|uniref:Uncharacterized protein n=1 Tax=Streptomyces phaeolivaceus TaxID=2653200 RepID=A0A5P8K4T5_9ACTN|nr:hypothetical protein [Streptomyces phaeolivaceus]QFQ98036.1 hypothetical protein F9278_19490 [Streptomyces phaeolivaceus]